MEKKRRKIGKRGKRKKGRARAGGDRGGRSRVATNRRAARNGAVKRKGYGRRKNETMMEIRCQDSGKIQGGVLGFGLNELNDEK